MNVFICFFIYFFSSIISAYKWNSFSGVVTSQRGDKSAAHLALWVSSSSLTACPLTRKANCALENIYEPGREIGLRSFDKEGGDGGEEEKKKEKTWNPRWDRGHNAFPLKWPGG